MKIKFIAIIILNFGYLSKISAETNPFMPTNNENIATSCIENIETLNSDNQLNLNEYKLVGIINKQDNSFIMLNKNNNITYVFLLEIIGKDNWQLVKITHSMAEFNNWNQTTACNQPLKLILKL